jgi:threonine dehydrogenase-like Zn-dependent dehydrogenase
MIAANGGTPPPGSDRLVIGHESFGVIVEAGEQSGLSVGDPVTILVRRPCNDPECVNCRNGEQDFCQTFKFVERGLKQADGFLTEYVAEDARYVVKVPHSLVPYGVLSEPQSIVEKVWNQVLRIQQRAVWQPETALIIGSGPLGLLAALTSRTLGLRTHVWSLSDEQSVNAEVARQCGAVYHPAAGSQLTKEAPQWERRFDLILECSGYPPNAFEAIQVLGTNGVLALLGVAPHRRMIEIPAHELNRAIVVQNKLILGSVNASRKDFETGLYRLGQMNRLYPGLLDQLVAERFTLEQVPDLDFKRIQIKPVVDIVPREQWENWIRPGKSAGYHFAV